MRDRSDDDVLSYAAPHTDAANLRREGRRRTVTWCRLSSECADWAGYRRRSKASRRCFTIGMSHCACLLLLPLRDYRVMTGYTGFGRCRKDADLLPGLHQARRHFIAAWRRHCCNDAARYADFLVGLTSLRRRDGDFICHMASIGACCPSFLRLLEEKAASSYRRRDT